MSDGNKNSNLGSLLKKLLEEQSLSFRRFSELTKIDTATISRIINGKRKATLEHLQRFANCLDVPIAELLTADGYPVKEEQQSDMHTALNTIQNLLESSNLSINRFSIKNVEQELANYEQYAETAEGKEIILTKFEEKLQKAGSIGPVIDQLQEMFESFRQNKGTIRERALMGSALIYFILTVDCIPDYLFPIGYIDDAIAVNFVLTSLQKRTGAK